MSYFFCISFFFFSFMNKYLHHLTEMSFKNLSLSSELNFNSLELATIKSSFHQTLSCIKSIKSISS
ncbi:MAG: hypothetical protein LBQ59_03150 [Candidatus Peribacteria bacterium]|nr:hypothetical protein [Candidatus Peribacteria bacterium]